MIFAKPGFVASIVFGATGVFVLGCSDDAGGGHTPSTGTVRLDLVAARDMLGTGNIALHDRTATREKLIMSKTIDVKNADETVPAFDGALDWGNYAVTFEGVSAGNSSCHSDEAFAVAAGTKAIQLGTITCALSPSSSPRATVNVTIQASLVDCPYLSDVQISPLQTGGMVSLSTLVVSPKPTIVPNTVTWHDGTTPIATGNTGTFDCATATAGTHTLGVTMTATNTPCKDTVQTAVTCVGGG